MSDPDTLLPPSSTPLERALSRTAGRFAPARLIPHLWNPDTCPPVMLPYLAWALSVDEWDHGWSTDKKREMIKAAREVHQTKGTLYSIRRALTAIGQPDAVIQERVDGWATYHVVLLQPVTIVQAFQIHRLLRDTGRNCIHLTAIDFAAAAVAHNGEITRNGTYTRGTVDTSI